MQPSAHHGKSQKLPWIKPEIVDVKVNKETTEAYHSRLLDDENFYKMADSGVGSG
jgi:hypothetical protein